MFKQPVTHSQFLTSKYGHPVRRIFSYPNKQEDERFVVKQMIKINILTVYLLTPWRRVLLGKLSGFQLIKKFPTFYGT